jgi:type I restriction enzyme M protein
MRIVDPDGWRQLMGAKPITFDVLERARERLSRPLAEATAALENQGNDSWRIEQLVRLSHSLYPSADARTFEHLLDRLAAHRGRSSGEYLLPTRLARLMVKLVDPKPGDHIHDPCCGHGSLLVAAGRQLAATASPGSRSAVLTGRAATQRSYAVATMNIAVNQVRARLDRDPAGDLSVVDTTVGQFDVVLLNPPFGRSEWRLAEANSQQQWIYGVPPPHSVAFAWVQAAAAAIGPAGRGAVVMPASSTSPTAPRERDIRERLLNRGVVRCVVELPGQLFRETAVPVTIWILGPPRSMGARDVLLIDGRAAAERTSPTHRELTEKGCAAILALYRGMLDGSLSFPQTSDKVPATTVDLSTLQEHGFELRPSAYLGRARSPATVERRADDLRALRDDLVQLDAAAGAADRDLEKQLERLAQWIP